MNIKTIKKPVFLTPSSRRRVSKLVVNFILIIIFGSLDIFARELKFESFENLGQKDLTAQTSPKYDLNGVACAVIKVALPQGVKFEGNIISYEYDVNEYIVYVSKGTKTLVIKCPGLETLYFSIPQSMYSTGLESGRTYRLKLEGFTDENDQLTEVYSSNLNYQKSGILTLKVEPKNAEIMINGIAQTASSDGQITLTLPLGTHSFRVNADKYYSSEGTATLSNKKDKVERIVRLKPKFGFLTIEASNDMNGVEVVIDNKHFGFMPIINQPIDNGTHKLKITSSFYHPYSQSIQVSDSSIIKIHPNFESNSAAIEIYTEDNEAELYDNGNKLDIKNGKWSGRFETGSHKIELRKSYHHTLTKIIKVEPNQNQTVKFNKMIAMHGSIKIITNPADADIYLKGEKVGSHKYIAKNLNPGWYFLEVKCPGFDTRQEWIYLNDGEEITRTVNLERTKTSCKISGSTGGDVYVDGVFKGSVPYTLYGYAGEKHKVKIVWPYTHLAKQKKKTIELGKDNSFYGVLEKHRNRGRQAANIFWTVLIPTLGWMSWLMNPVDE